MLQCPIFPQWQIQGLPSTQRQVDPSQRRKGAWLLHLWVFRFRKPSHVISGTPHSCQLLQALAAKGLASSSCCCGCVAWRQYFHNIWNWPFWVDLNSTNYQRPIIIIFNFNFIWMARNPKSNLSLFSPWRWTNHHYSGCLSFAFNVRNLSEANVSVFRTSGLHLVNISHLPFLHVPSLRI